MRFSQGGSLQLNSLYQLCAIRYNGELVSTSMDDETAGVLNMF
jgi:hypothetical protein